MRQIAFVILGFLSLNVAHATSFDCTKARSVVEKMICADAALSKLDDSLNAQYQQILQRDEIKEDVIKSQRAWLKNSRNICQTNECVNKAYETRIMELGLTSSLGLVFTRMPPNSKPPAAKSPADAVPAAVSEQETKKITTISLASPDEYLSPDSRCPDNIGTARKYDIYHGSWITYAQDRALPFGLNDKAITILNTMSEMELATLCDGNIVAAWLGYFPGMRREKFVSVRIYDSQFIPLTDEFKVNASGHVQSDQSVAPLKNGGFVVTWRTNSPNAVEEFATRLHARIFSPNGKPISNMIDISSNKRMKTQAKAYGLPNGGFVVAWSEELYSIYLRYFDANGKPISDAIPLLSSSDLATIHDVTDYGYVARDGSLNLFVTNWRKSSIFSKARSASLAGVPQSKILDQDELKNLPGYQLMVDWYVRNKALRIGSAALPGFNSHDKGGKLPCKWPRTNRDLAWLLHLHTDDTDVLKLINQVNDAFSKCP